MQIVNMAREVGSDLFGLYSAIIGAVVGATASAIPAYYLAARASKETLRRDQQGRTERERTLAFRLMLSFTGIVNELRATREQVEVSIAKSEATLGKGLALWLRLPPFIGNTERQVEVTTEEIAILYSRNADLAADVLQQVDRHRIFQTVVAMYRIRRGELGDRTGGPMTGDPHALQEIAFNSHGPITADVESLAFQLRRSLERDSNEAIRLLPLMAAAFGEYFGDPNMFKLTLVGGGQKLDVA